MALCKQCVAVLHSNLFAVLQCSYPATTMPPAIDTVDVDVVLIDIGQYLAL